MDEPVEPAPKDAPDAERTDYLALGVVFLAVGVTLVLSLDTPWAGSPMVVLGLYFMVVGLRARRRARQ